MFALKDALVSARKDDGLEETVTLYSPATAERLRHAIGDDLSKMGTVQPKEGEKNSSRQSRGVAAQHNSCPAMEMQKQHLARSEARNVISPRA